MISLRRPLEAAQRTPEYSLETPQRFLPRSLVHPSKGFDESSRNPHDVLQTCLRGPWRSFRGISQNLQDPSISPYRSLQDFDGDASEMSYRAGSLQRCLKTSLEILDYGLIDSLEIPSRFHGGSSELPQRFLRDSLGRTLQIFVKSFRDRIGIPTRFK